jgi:hypothetical protein
MRQLNNAKESTYLIEVQNNAKESKKQTVMFMRLLILPLEMHN